MKLNLKRGAALVLTASMTLQAPVPALAKVVGRSANPAAYSTSSGSAELTAPEGTETAAASDSSNSAGAETSAPVSTETAAAANDGKPEIGSNATSIDETQNTAQSGSQSASPA